MNFLTAAGISVGGLGALWTMGSSSAGLVSWIGFLAWACFYASGGKLEGLKNTLISNVNGVLWGFITIKLVGYLTPYIGGIPSLGVVIFIIVNAMCWQAKISVFSFIPGTFVGTASFFGAAFDLRATLIPLVVCGLLGYVSEYIALLMMKKEEKSVNNTVT